MRQLLPLVPRCSFSCSEILAWLARPIRWQSREGAVAVFLQLWPCFRASPNWLVAISVDPAGWPSFQYSGQNRKCLLKSNAPTGFCLSLPWTPIAFAESTHASFACFYFWKSSSFAWLRKLTGCRAFTRVCRPAQSCHHCGAAPKAALPPPGGLVTSWFWVLGSSWSYPWPRVIASAAASSTCCIEFYHDHHGPTRMHSSDYHSCQQCVHSPLCSGSEFATELPFAFRKRLRSRAWSLPSSLFLGYLCGYCWFLASSGSSECLVGSACGHLAFSGWGNWSCGDWICPNSSPGLCLSSSFDDDDLPPNCPDRLEAHLIAAANGARCSIQVSGGWVSGQTCRESTPCLSRG